jgi:hypothetical protein
MRMLPEVNSCFHVHTAGFVVCFLSFLYMADPTLFAAVQLDDTLRSWPEIWVAVPFFVLTVNMLFFFIERSLMGFLAVVACSGLLVYHAATYSLILLLMGNQP